MKKGLLLIALFLGIALGLVAQSVPQGMNYQAVARDMDGRVLADQQISLKISLLGDNPDGKVMYSEIHEVETSGLGLFNVVIGEGVAGLGDFAEISWGSVQVWMDMALELNDDYVSIATTRLLTVPYAFHAGTADEIKDGSSTEKGLSVYWKTNGNNNTTSIPHFLGTLNAKDLIFKTNSEERMRILSSGDLQMSGNNIKNLADPVEAQDAVTKGYVDVVQAALEAHLAADNDLSPTNELNTGVSLIGTVLMVKDNGGSITTDLGSLEESAEVAAAQAAIDAHIQSDGDTDPTNELQNWSTLPGIPADIADGDQVNDADADPTNELQNWSTLPGIPADIADGDQVNDADADPTNEIELPANPQNGTMAYYNSGAWKTVAPGTQGQVLTFSGGVPVWAGPAADPPSSNLQIGDPYAGGIIFYLDASGEHGLVAATSDQSSGAQWGCFGTAIGGTSTAVGSGQANTTAILNECSDSGIAARICADYSVTVGGDVLDDWFLPSKDELNLMYVNLHLNALGGFVSNDYWSSTEYDNDNAWLQGFYNGYQSYFYKDYSIRVRAVRAF
jgi:hypothetical protein